jgi:ABC-type nitrate/sulfonate/bicarbonate transport system permease component
MIARLASLAVVIGVWWWLSLGASALGLPGPVQVLDALARLAASGRLLSALSVTLGAFAAGGTLAILIGVPLGIFMGVRRSVGLAIDPILTALYVMPFSAVIPLFVLWFGIDEMVRLAFIFTFTVPQVAIVCYQGAKSTPTTLVEVARTYLASGRQIFWKVILPYEVPFIFTSLRLGVGLAIQAMVVAELLIQSVRGLGFLLQFASASFDLATVLGVILFIMLLGAGAVAIMQRIETSVAPWREGMSADGGGSNV